MSNSDSSKLLTIGIPTYNRYQYLKEGLPRILEQTIDFSNEIEIIVSDNCSDDDTKILLERYKHEYPNLTVHRQRETLPSALNFSFLLQNANSDFVWLISDDDIVLKDTIPTVLQFLKKNTSINLVYLNGTIFHEKNKMNPLNNKTCLEEVSFCTNNKDRFLSCIGCNITFLSTLIFNKRSLNCIYETLIRDCDEYFLQSYAAFLCCKKPNSNMGYIADVCIAAKANYDVNYNMYEVFGTHLYNLLMYAYKHCGFSKKKLNKEFIVYWKKQAKNGVVGAKIRGTRKMYTGFGRFFRITWRHPSAWILYPSLLFPAPLYSLARKIYKYLRTKI